MRCLLLVLSLTLAASAQQNENKIRVEFRVLGKPKAPPPPEAEPGDSVEMDRVSGAIIATSRGRSFTFHKSNFIGPLLRVSYSAVADQLEYLYTLGNAAGSANTISAFALYLPEPAAALATAPPSWSHLAILMPAPPEVPSVLFLNAEKDGTDTGRLSAGRQMGPFRIKAQGMPGLVRVVFRPEQDPPKPEGQNDGDFFNWASAWVRERLLAVDTHDRHELRSWTIGPKRGSAGNDLAAIQTEIREGALVPEFGRTAVEIMAIAALSDPAAIRNRLDKLTATPFQREWVKALMWRLDRLK